MAKKIVLEPTSVIEAKLGIQDNGPVEAFFANECMKAMRRYVPYREGELVKARIHNNNEIWYEQNYARYQYYGVREDGTHKVHKYTTPGTGPYWDKVMWAIHGDNITKRVQALVDKGQNK